MNEWWYSIYDKKPKGFVNVGRKFYEYEVNIILINYNINHNNSYETIIPVVIRTKVNNGFDVDNMYVYKYMKRIYDVDICGFNTGFFKRDGGYFPYINNIELYGDDTKRYLEYQKLKKRIIKINNIKYTMK